MHDETVEKLEEIASKLTGRLMAASSTNVIRPVRTVRSARNPRVDRSGGSNQNS